MAVTYCRHNWEKIRLVRKYIDYSGFEVVVFECKCTKCGKIKEKKFW